MTFYYFQVLVLKWHDFLDKFVKAVGKAGLRFQCRTIECRKNGHTAKRGTATKYACDKGWSHLESRGAESRAKMAGMHIDGLGKNDAAH